MIYNSKRYTNKYILKTGSMLIRDRKGSRYTEVMFIAEVVYRVSASGQLTPLANQDSFMLPRFFDCV